MRIANFTFSRRWAKIAIKSAWVEKEIETVFEREVNDGSTILIPVRIDDDVLTTAAGWAADVRRQRNIGDFRDWNHVGTYQRALNRLLSSLRQAPDSY